MLDDTFTEWEVYDTAFDETVEDEFSTEFGARQYMKWNFGVHEQPRFKVRSYQVSYTDFRRV